MLAPSRDDFWGFLVIYWNGLSLISPGVATLSGHDRVIGWDVKDASGQTGASSERKGEPIKRFRSSFYLTDEPWEETSSVAGEGEVTDDFYQWSGFELILRESYGGDKPLALSLYHPDLERNGISAACVDRIGGMQLDGKGGATVEVDWVEYRPAKAKGGAQDPDDEPDKKTASDYEIERLLKEGEDLDKQYEDL